MSVQSQNWTIASQQPCDGVHHRSSTARIPQPPITFMRSLYVQIIKYQTLVTVDNEPTLASFRISAGIWDDASHNSRVCHREGKDVHSRILCFRNRNRSSSALHGRSRLFTLQRSDGEQTRRTRASVSIGMLEQRSTCWRRRRREAAEES